MTAPKPQPTHGRRTWIVKCASGGEVTFLADYHRTRETRDGIEAQFFNRGLEADHRVATVRPGSWHFVVQQSARVEEDES